MKKIIASILALILLTSLVACGNKIKNEKESTTTQKETTTTEVSEITTTEVSETTTTEVSETTTTEVNETSTLDISESTTKKVDETAESESTTLNKAGESESATEKYTYIDEYLQEMDELIKNGYEDVEISASLLPFVLNVKPEKVVLKKATEEFKKAAEKYNTGDSGIVEEEIFVYLKNVNSSELEISMRKKMENEYDSEIGGFHFKGNEEIINKLNLVQYESRVYGFPENLMDLTIQWGHWGGNKIFLTDEDTAFVRRITIFFY